VPVSEVRPPRPSSAVGLTYARLLLATVFWGGTAVAGKIVIAGLPPLTAGVLRYGAAAVLLGVAFRRRLPNPAVLGPKDLAMLLAIGALGTFLNHVLFFFGLVWAPAAHGALIPPTTSPIWMLVLAARLGRERVGRAQVAGIALCLVGVVLVVRPERLLTEGGAGVLFGDLLFLLGGLTWALYSHLSRVAMQRLSAGGILAVGMAVGSLLLLPFALAERPWAALAAAGAASWLALAYLTLMGTVLAFLWWNVGIRRLGTGRAAAFSNLVPVFGVLAAWLVLGERLGGWQVLGAGLALLGVLICQDPSRWRRAE
jgi:drug/metabolite transporter (DMT)-like permease